MKRPRAQPRATQGPGECWPDGTEHQLDAETSAAGTLDPGAPPRARVAPERLLRALRVARARRLALALEASDAARSR